VVGGVWLWLWLWLVVWWQHMCGFLMFVFFIHHLYQVNDALSNILLDGWIKLVQATERIHTTVRVGARVLACVHNVYWHVLTMCTRNVYSQCVLTMCTHNVYSNVYSQCVFQCVLTMCTRNVYSQCVFQCVLTCTSTYTHTCTPTPPPPPHRSAKAVRCR